MKKNEIEKNYGKSTTKGFMGLFYSFKYAIKGIATCFLQERNMRIHVIATIYVFALGVLFQFDKTHFIVLTAVCGLVIICEMFNTAIELLCDINEPDYNPLAGRLKDIAAGAVLIASLIALVVGLFIFVTMEHLMTLKDFFWIYPLRIILLLVSVAVSWVIVDGKWIPKIFGTKYEGDKNGKF